MGHYLNLDSQQTHLSAQDYDLRITNLARFIRKKMGKPGKLIDIGAGNGLVLRFFKKSGYKVTGMELSPELCIAMKKNPAMKGITVVQGDIAKTRGKADFEFVLASDVIEHIKDDKKAMANLFSFVAPGGLLVISVPAHSTLYGKRDKIWGHYRRYDKDELVKKAESLGGKIEFVSQWNFIGFFAYWFYEKVLGKPISEEFRNNPSLPNRIVRSVLDKVFRLEEAIGGTPVGLTLVIGVRK